MSASPDKSSSAVRIIGGRWRGRKLRFNGGGIRPSGDRVRETLFNWLAPQLPGARCLDLFAGSGALGIEALSRGAAAATFVERNRNTARQITTQLETLQAADAQVVTADAWQLDLVPYGPFDVVFLDPPFAAATDGTPPPMGNLCTLLEQSGSLAESCRVYLEMSRSQALPELPANWQVLRDKTAAKVRFALALRSAE